MDDAMKKVIISVVITTIIVIISIPLWLYSSRTKSKMVASSTNSMDVAIEMGNFDSLFVIEEERAFEYIKPTIVSMRNRNDEEKTFELVFLVDKESTVPFHQIVVSLDKNVYKLKHMNMSEDEKNYYFSLEKITLDRYSEIEKEARIWLSDASKSVDESAILKTNFITR